MYAYRVRGGSGSGALMFILILVLMGAVAYLLYRDTQDDQDEPKSSNTYTTGTVYTQEDGTKVFSGIEPVDCSGDIWVKKTECSRDGFLLDGTPGNCGEGEEEWVLDPEAPGYVAAIGMEGKCLTQMRPCEVECDIPCEGDTWLAGECKRNGVVLDGSAEFCGQGMLEKTLDESAPDFIPARGNGSCTKNYGSACFVPCPPAVPPPPACTYQTTWQRSANGCVKTKEDKADPVGYDETGWQELFKIALEGENCTGEQRLVEWETCKGDPAPVNCEGSWGTGDGWGLCIGECGRQPSQSRTFTRTKEAAHGGTCTLPAHNTTETRNCGSIDPCPVDCAGYWQDPVCPSHCGYSGGQINNSWITTIWPVGTGVACPSPSTKDCPAMDPCPIDCQGYHEDPACPSACGTAASTVTKKWITTVTPNSTGTACPADSSKSCPATSACPADCEGHFEDSGGAYWPSPAPCGSYTLKQKRVYKITKNKVGTGNDCPYADGHETEVAASPRNTKTRRCKGH